MRPGPPRPVARTARAASLVAWCWMAGCDAHVDVVATPRDAGAAAAQDMHCDYSHAVIAAAAGDGRLADLAAAAQDQALCTCTGLAAADRLRVEGGDALVDGAMSLQAAGEFGGALRVADAAGLMLGPAPLTVGASLTVGGPLLGGESTVTVVGDARVGGRVQLRGLVVGGDLVLDDDVQLAIAGGSPPPVTRQAPAATTLACPCTAGERLASDGAAFDAATSPEPLDTAAAEAVTLDRDCAVYRLDDGAPLPATVLVQQSSLLLVDGDLQLGRGLQVEVAEGAALDLLVRGNLLVDGPLQLGSLGTGGHVRVFIGGSGTIELREGGHLRGLLHAPAAELVLPAPLHVEGQLLVRRLAASAALTISR